MQRRVLFNCQFKKLKMKPFFIWFSVIVTLALITSCKKDKGPDTATLIGTWELSQAQNGMIPTITYPSGNGNILKFTSTTYENYNNHILVKSGTYTIVVDTTVKETVGLELPAGQYTTRIIFDDNFTAPKIFLQIAGNNLYFLSGYFPTDGGSGTSYIKIN